ncbi:MAG: endonuclease/exonuclease/phosphatase family protein [Bacteroidaceae bacterium]|nr:endonuclease/exonuclease/phosphatase family protein [Bacteroidaceae bacterium]
MAKTNTPTTSPKKQEKAPKKGQQNKKASRLYLIFANIITGCSLVSVVLLCISVGSTYISPEKIRILSLAGLAFPFFLGGTIFMLFISLIFAWRRSWIPFVGLLLCSSTIYDYFPINLPSPAPKQSLKIMTYNTACFGLWTGQNKSKNTKDGDNRLVRDIILESPDIVGYQEGIGGNQYTKHVRPILKRNGFYADSIRANESYLGCFSRYPILEKEVISCVEGNNAAVFKIKLSNADTLYFIVMHLKSMGLTAEDRDIFKDNVDNLRDENNEEDLDFQGLFHVARKIARASEPRAQQADNIARYIEDNKHRNLIVCGDFNDTPVSYTYRTIASAGNLDDAFVQAGNGLGRTFNRHAMVVRIDHILYGEDFWEPHAAHVLDRPDRSDHNAVTVHLKRKK